MLSIGKCPYRVSLLGGGSDLDWYLERKMRGFSLGYSLNKYSYAVVNQLDENSKQGILNYSIRENYKQLDDICNPLIREALRSYGGRNFFEISTFGFALGGSGLGGSSSFLIALLAALQKSNNCKINNFDLALEAAKLEIFNIKKPIGYQDHFLSALGDINCLAFSKGSNVKTIELSNEKK